MSNVLVTRLRRVYSKDADKIELFPNMLTYKIEIKSISQDKNGRWVLWFVPPDDIEDGKVMSGSLD